MFVLVKYLHFLSILFLFAALVAEHLLLAARMTRAEIARVAVVDAVYGISAVLVLATGAVMLFWAGKGSAFYLGSWIFHLKLGLFFAAALISVWPTVKLIGLRRGDPGEAVELPRALIMCVRLELLLVALIPLTAVLAVAGYGRIG